MATSACSSVRLHPRARSAPIAAGDPSNVDRIAVAEEVEELPWWYAAQELPLCITVAPNTSIRNWRRARYEQGYQRTYG